MRIDTKSVWLLKKEIKSVFRSRWLLMGFVLAPVFAWLFEGAFMSLMVAQTTEEYEKVYITVEDEGIWGRRLLEEMEANKSLLRIDPLVEIDRAQGEELVMNRSVSVWILVPANFSEVLNSTGKGLLSCWVDLASFRATATAQRVDQFVKRVINEVIVIREVEVSWYAVAPDTGYGHQLAILLVMITSILAPAPYVSQSFAGERENRTLEALLVVPMTRLRILASKLTAGLLLALIYAGFTVVGIVAYNALIVTRAASVPPDMADYYTRLYTVNMATIPLILLCQLLVLFCAIGIGIVISCLARDQSTAESINNLVLLLPTMIVGMLGFLGGVTQYGGLFGLVIMLIPFTHAVIFLNALLSGTVTMSSVLGIIYLLVFTVGTLTVGARLFEREAIVT